ncbi:MAG: site-specific integrase [Planctomycetota bacterium]|nr:MAG: site-specific integrase [Planctomycetota bacterium]
MAHVRLSDRKLRSLKPGSYRDQASPLTVRVSPTGRIKFEVRYMDTRADGTRYQARRGLGVYPAMSLAQARAQAIDVKHQSDSGEAAPAPQVTFGELAESFMEKHAAVNKRPASIRTDRQKLDLDLLPLWGHRPAVEINRRDVVEMMDRILARATKPGGNVVVANRTRVLASAIFNYGIARGLVEHNPVQGTRPAGQERPRDRYLSEDEMRILWQVWSSEGGTMANLFKALLLTAQRPGEVAGMAWAEIEDDVWILPPERTKGKRRHVVPLSEPVLAILDRQRRLPTGPWVFPSRNGHHVAALNRACERYTRASADLTPDGEPVGGWSPHVLRKTAADHMARLGVQPHVRSAVLNHKLPGVTERSYTAYTYFEEKRAALKLWGDFVDELVG